MHNLLSVANIFRTRSEEGNPAKDPTSLHSRYSIDRLNSQATGSSTHSNPSSLPHPHNQHDTQASDESAVPRSAPMESNDDTRHPPQSLSVTSSRPSLLSRHSYLSRLSDDDASPLPSPTKKKRRFNFPLPFFSKSHEHPAPATLAFVVESPPVLFYLDPERSTGALVSGQVVIDVKEELLEVNSVAASVTKTVVHKKPFQSHCDDCTAHEEELQHWTLVAQPLLLSRGELTLFFFYLSFPLHLALPMSASVSHPANTHVFFCLGLHKFPFTGILEGHLPITTETNLVSISYELRATTLVSRHPVTPDGPGIPIFHSEPLQVRRSLPETDAPHNSVRVFPPTNIRASAQYQQVLYPSGRNNLTMALDGLTTKLVQEDSVECWRLKKASWRLEESIKAVSNACARHATPLTDPAQAEAETNRNRIPRTETRVIGEEIISRDWKSDYLSADGHIELFFDFGLHPAFRKPQPHHPHYYPHYHHNAHRDSELPRFVCDTATAQGTQISHSLLVELIVSRARAPASKPDALVDTGTGRILRMRFRVYLTDKPGSRVAWDDEAPPMYDEVPPSPPCYEGGDPNDSDGADHHDTEPIYAARDSVEWREGDPASPVSSTSSPSPPPPDALPLPPFPTTSSP